MPESIESTRPQRVLVTGASGFVGRYVVRELVARGYGPVCLVRNPEKLREALSHVDRSRYTIVRGDLHDTRALNEAAGKAQAVIHLVGIILDRPLKGQTFSRIHVEGTRHVMQAAEKAGIRRFVHMSALGAEADAESSYLRTKYQAEEIVRNCGLRWTIFRPSIIHGADGEFMQLMKTFVTMRPVWQFGFIPQQIPVIPYFGRGDARIQPVSVKDVAHCFAACLDMPETFGRFYELGGPEALSWKALYRMCRQTIPGAVGFKPMVSLPVPLAKLAAATVMRTPLVPVSMRFNVGQVQMSQQDSVCDTAPVEEAFGIRLRDFRFELSHYA
ncbi:MAG: complex I NDUFA9 subunit family protein, partial [Phycisphaerae bacterium]